MRNVILCGAAALLVSSTVIGATAPRISGLVAAKGETTLQIATKAEGTKSVGIDQKTSYMKWITEKPFGADARDGKHGDGRQLASRSSCATPAAQSPRPCASTPSRRAACSIRARRFDRAKSGEKRLSTAYAAGSGWPTPSGGGRPVVPRFTEEGAHDASRKWQNSAARGRARNRRNPPQSTRRPGAAAGRRCNGHTGRCACRSRRRFGHRGTGDTGNTRPPARSRTGRPAGRFEG